MNSYRYRLEAYRGMATLHECPQCGRRSFKRYVDVESGEALREDCGRCNHVNSCGYHLAPRDVGAVNESVALPARQMPQPQQHSVIPGEMVKHSLRSDFARGMCRLMGEALTTEVLGRYRVGADRMGRVIWWQIDESGETRTGKVMAYDPLTLKRRREMACGVDWAHSILIRIGQLPIKFVLKQCLFGAHLLARAVPTDVVCLVESEKTAVLCAAIWPRGTWLATGGITQLEGGRMEVLRGRRVLVFADSDAVEDWSLRLDAYRFTCSLRFSRAWPTIIAERPSRSKIDLADVVIEALSDATGQKLAALSTITDEIDAFRLNRIN